MPRYVHELSHFSSVCHFPDSTCVSECPAGTYNTRQGADGTELGFCLLCDHACATCTGASPRDCLTCSPGHLRLLQLCVTHCPKGYKGKADHCLENVYFVLQLTVLQFPVHFPPHPLSTDINTEYVERDGANVCFLWNFFRSRATSSEIFFSQFDM